MRIRRRRDQDLPVLELLLAEQQPTSSYPIRWPLPFPIRDFLVRSGERRAWVAEDPESDAGLLGHVAVVDPEELGPTFAAAVGTPRLGMVAVLFTSLAARGRGVGGLLHDTAVSWIRERGEVPVLDVIPVHDRATQMYLSRGWVELAQERLLFDWLPPDLPAVRLMALPPYPGTPSRSSTSA